MRGKIVKEITCHLCTLSLMGFAWDYVRDNLSLHTYKFMLQFIG